MVYMRVAGASDIVHCIKLKSMPSRNHEKTVIMWRQKRVWINCSLMGILFFAAVQAEPGGQMVKMEAKHETNAIFAASPHLPRKICDQNEILVWEMGNERHCQKINSRAGKQTSETLVYTLLGPVGGY